MFAYRVTLCGTRCSSFAGVFRGCNRGARGLAPPGSLQGMSTLETHEDYPGQGLGLPQSGRGSLASWWSRITALVLDWAVSMIVAVAIFGTEVLTGNGWRSFMILAVFFVEASVMTALTGGSIGQLLTRIAVIRLGHDRVGWVRAVGRTLLVCLVIPPLVIGVHRRGLHDLVCGTVVVNRR